MLSIKDRLNMMERQHWEIGWGEESKKVSMELMFPDWFQWRNVKQIIIGLLALNSICLVNSSRMLVVRQDTHVHIVRGLWFDSENHHFGVCSDLVNL